MSIPRPPDTAPTGSGFARLLGRLVPGVGRVVDQIGPYATAWAEDTAEALASEAPLLAVLGDSTAQGVGAGHHREGWAGQVHEWLEQTTRSEWAVANWSRTGAKVADVLDHQLPQLDAAPRRPDLVMVAVGSNDVFWGVRTGSARRAMRELLTRLPSSSVIATIPAGGLAVRARWLNQVVRSTAAAHGSAVAEIDEWVRGGRGRMLASDGFHPNERGYERWALAFEAAIAQSELGERLGVPDL